MIEIQFLGLRRGYEAFARVGSQLMDRLTVLTEDPVYSRARNYSSRIRDALAMQPGQLLKNPELLTFEYPTGYRGVKQVVRFQPDLSDENQRRNVVKIAEDLDRARRLGDQDAIRKIEGQLLSDSVTIEGI